MLFDYDYCTGMPWAWYVLSHDTMPQRFLRVCAFGMLAAGISTTAVAHELNAYFITIISHLHCNFRETFSTHNQQLGLPTVP